MNFLLFAYVEESEARKMKAIIDAVKNKFPSEGISIFIAQGVEF
jgi:hypothetical protein